ncbi:hypothetical protein [Acinetobacter sp. P8-3-8]|uniref:hypothetical protein n=1 Tax=Acinetobacter sp. P8-3-8 TaxID=1029823 RepID=UPI0002487A7D|nr:hypothetical protein [Acinetobacter sp. P8-3-8]
MNVNLQEHQRSLMATMGIDLWVPRSDVQTRPYQNNLYRDIASLEHSSVMQFDASQNLSQTIHAQPIQQLAQAHTTDVAKTESKSQAENSSLKQNIEIQQKSESSVSEQIAKQVDFHTEPAIQLDAFEVQAFCIANCVILVDCTKLTADQLQLWLNIQHAIVGQYYELKWPFPMLQLQDGKGAHIYIQGFIDSLKNERKVLSLGQLPHLQATDIIQLASLQEMIDQPVLKRRLWQFMQNRVN